MNLPVSNEHALAVQPLLRAAAKGVPEYDLLLGVDPDVVTAAMLYNKRGVPIGDGLVVWALTEIVEGTESLMSTSPRALRNRAILKIEEGIEDLHRMVDALRNLEIEE